MKVSVSFISSNYSLKDTIKRVSQTDCEYLHVDLMDGKFVENKNFTYSDIEKLTNGINKPLDIHFMCENPSKDFNKYAMLNTHFLTFHYEAVKNPQNVINEIKDLGIGVGMSIKLETNISDIKNYLPLLDQVLVMSVNPGKGGQPFDERATSKIDELKSLKEQNNYHYVISVDGGINEDTIELVSNSDMVVSGSYICKSDNFQKQIDKLR